MYQRNHKPTNVRTGQAGTTSVVPVTPMIFVVRYCAFIQMPTALTAFPMEIFFRRERRKQDLKFMSWETATHGVLRLTAKPDGYIGEKWVRMQMMIRKRPGWEWMNSTRPGVPDILDGLILSEIMWDIPCMIMCMIQSTRPRIPHIRCMI